MRRLSGSLQSRRRPSLSRRLPRRTWPRRSVYPERSRHGCSQSRPCSRSSACSSSDESARLTKRPLVRWIHLNPPRMERPLTEPQQILVAPAWPYANGPRHIGHLAGFGVPADVFARYQRLRGHRRPMGGGRAAARRPDAHGTPILLAADQEGRSYRETADRYSSVIREDLRDLGLTYDLFTRTTTQNHHRVVRDLFRTLYDKG